MVSKLGMKWVCAAAVVFAWAATNGVAITFASSPSKKPPSVSIDNLTRAAAAAANSGHFGNAFRLYRQLAEKGDARAQYILGGMYGDSVPRNLKEALKWYQLPAAQGYADAQYMVGTMYEEGKGVPQDKKEAIKFYQLAAAQGYAEAEYKLGAKVRPPPPTAKPANPEEEELQTLAFFVRYYGDYRCKSPKYYVKFSKGYELTCELDVYYIEDRGGHIIVIVK